MSFCFVYIYFLIQGVPLAAIHQETLQVRPSLHPRRGTRVMMDETPSSKGEEKYGI